MATIEARDDCAGDSAGIRFVPCRSSLTVEQIASEVGYGDPGAFRQIFSRFIGLTPGEYRQRFGAFS